MMHPITRYARTLAIHSALALAIALPLHAQRTHVLLVIGLSGEPQFKRSFEASAQSARNAAKSRWGVSDSSLIVLTEDSVRTALSSGRSTRENIAQAFLTLSSRVQPGDVLFVMLMGHGSGEGAQSKVNLPGPDAAASGADFGNAAGLSGQLPGHIERRMKRQNQGAGFADAQARAHLDTGCF
jgi:hypothetical protein